MISLHVRVYLLRHPQSRVSDLFRLYINTGCRKQMECIWCGALGPSWSAKWPKTKRATEWEVDHRATHDAREVIDSLTQEELVLLGSESLSH